jgi:hypothetical protein
MPVSEEQRVQELTAWGKGAHYPLRDDSHEQRLAALVADDPPAWWQTARNLITQASDENFADNLDVPLAIILEAGGPALVERAGREARDASGLAEALYNWPVVHRWRSELYRLIGRDRLVQHYFTERKAAAWPWRMMEDLRREDPEEAWQVTLQLIAAAPDGDALSYVAAGPLEDLIKDRGDQFIDRIEAEAAGNARLRQALGKVWIWDLLDSKSELFTRIEKAAGAPLARPTARPPD